MNMPRPRRASPRVCATVLLWAVACGAGLSAAAEFTIDRTRIELRRDHAVETIELGNREPGPIAFEVEVKRWRQDAEGRWQLEPTTDLVVHPLILTVPAGGRARLRVGTLAPTVAEEAAYRLELQQLRGAGREGASHVRILTRMSLPVFVEPPEARARMQAEVAAIDGDSVDLVLRNAGTGYQGPGEARLQVFDASGRVLHEAGIQAGYVLAGARLPLAAALPAGACARAARVVLLLDGAGSPLAAPVAPGSRRCAR